MVKHNKRFCVLLAAYNGMRFIEEQITSILEQVEVDVEIYVSVDMSADGTEDFIVKWAERDKRVKLLPTGERFGGASNNFYRLIKEVNFLGFDYISLSDQDDVWNNDKLIRAHRVLLEHGAHAYSSNVTAVWDDGSTKVIRKSFPQTKYDYYFESAGPGCTYVINVSTALDLQNFLMNSNPNLLKVDYHDWLIYAYVRNINLKWIIDDHSSMQYRQHSNNQIGANVGYKSFYLRVKQVLNGYGFNQTLLIANLLDSERINFIYASFYKKRLGFLILAKNFLECRRKSTDKLLFLISCLIMFIIGKYPEIDYD